MGVTLKDQLAAAFGGSIASITGTVNGLNEKIQIRPSEEILTDDIYRLAGEFFSQRGFSPQPQGPWLFLEKGDDLVGRVVVTNHSSFDHNPMIFIDTVTSLD